MWALLANNQISFISFHNGWSLLNCVWPWFWEVLKMNNVFLPCLSRRTNWTTNSQHIWFWLCTCMHKISIVWKTSHLLLQSNHGIKRKFERKNSSFWEHKPKFLKSLYILSFLWFSCWIVMCQMNFPLRIFSVHFLVCDDSVCIFHFLICIN